MKKLKKFKKVKFMPGEEKMSFLVY
ncbi:hypothetical protein [Bacteroides thetaiotaomicron]